MLHLQYSKKNVYISLAYAGGTVYALLIYHKIQTRMSLKRKSESELKVLFYSMLMEMQTSMIIIWNMLIQLFYIIYTRKMKKICWALVIILSIGINLLCFLSMVLPSKSNSFEQSQISSSSLFSTNNKFIPKYKMSFKNLSLDLNAYKTNHSKILGKKLLPWLLHSNLTYYRGEKNSKGIVICTGNQHFHEVIVAIKSLEAVDNDLPIEVVYSTVNDLSLENQETFRKTFPNVPLIDLSLTAFNDSYLKLRGWETKPYAILASRFEQVLLMDADVLFFEKPSVLFDHELFNKTGTLFFHDRPDFTEENIRWIQTFVFNYKQQLPKRQQESGIVLIDKSRVLDGLLAVCKLNDFKERKLVTYKQLYGDKDTFWLGLHMVNIPYAFLPTMPAAIGQITSRNNKLVVCGQMLHFDETYRLLWWNGGLLNNRFTGGKTLTQITGWLEEGMWTFNYEWCVVNNKQRPKQFNEDQQRLIIEYGRIVKEVFDLD